MLLPESADFPSACSAGVAGPIVDDILTWRPDIAHDLLRGLRQVSELPAQQGIAKLMVEDQDAYEALRVTVLGAYYLNPVVWEKLGYRGQESLPVPLDETADYLESGLLEPVKARGTIWRKTDQGQFEIKDKKV